MVSGSPPRFLCKEETVRGLTWDQIAKLKSQTYFDQFEIEALHEQYKSLCTSKRGISREVYDMCLGPLGQEKNLVLDRLFKFYDKNEDAHIDFDEMVKGLSVLVKGNHREKVEYAFNGYDLDGVGAISRDNLRKMFKSYFYITIELVRDVVKACEEEMMSNFDDSQGKPVSSLFSAPIPTETGAVAGTGKIPFPGNPGGREGMWPVMEAMSQDAIDEMVDNVFKMADVDLNDRESMVLTPSLSPRPPFLAGFYHAPKVVYHPL
ncbi:recoverin family protein DDB_G0274781-like [Glandiceps talaboti]